MLSNKNKVVIASAGSRKTTFIVETALAIVNKNVLIATYTNENLDQINAYVVEKKGYVPPNITVASWYSFLLQDGVRPYQNHMTNKGRIKSIDFTSTPNRFIKKEDVDRFFLTGGGNIYRDRVACFIYECDNLTKGLVIQRLEKIYSHIFIDEIQDFAGYDLDILEKLFRSSIATVGVGDPRQATFSTNNSAKNRKFKKSEILEWVNAKQKSKLLHVEERNDCYRSNQLICDFADALFPKLPKAISKNNKVTGHDGIFFIKNKEALNYYKTHKPVVLRYSKKTDTLGLPASNIGTMKGRTFERVLIFPTSPMKAYLTTNDLSQAGDLSKLYVAVTRAKYSVAFVV
jgi:DNA helicase-2/ATP-dependent DNA helicase PcrA